MQTRSVCTGQMLADQPTAATFRSVSKLEPGAIIAKKFRLTAQVGVGGMGTVWRARHLTLGCDVALKVVNPNLRDEKSVRRFMNEARAAAALRSLHVVQVLDHGVDAGVPYLAMEFLEGATLRSRLDRGELSLPFTERVVRHISRALTRAHAAGIVHRDLKPENIFLCPNDDELIVKVLDFGIAKCVDPEWAMQGGTNTGALMGTPFYMSPEQVQAVKTLDHRSDLWSLGVIAYECLTGLPPFRGSGVGDVMASILRDPAPPLPESVPDGLRDWMSTALNKDPRRRFGTAREMAESLRQIAWEGKAPDAVEGDLGPEVSLEGPTPCFWTPDTELVEATPACGATLVDMAKSPPGNGPAFRTRSRWNLSAALGASILVLVAGAVGLGAWRDVDHRADVADANTPPHIFLRISAAPLDARLVLDGKVLPSNPFEAEVARDGEAHLLRVEAPGHAVVERVLSFQGDVLLALALTPSSSEATGSTGSATPASPHVQATRVPFGAQHSSPRAQRPESRKPLPEGSNPRGVPSPRTARPIDEGDPYSE